MKQKYITLASIVAVCLLCGLLAAQAQISSSRGSSPGLAGQWRITYFPNKATRTYTIERNGRVYFRESSARSQIDKTDQGFLLRFDSEPKKLERLTLGNDGRLFVEHFNPANGFPNAPDQIGIGVRQ